MSHITIFISNSEHLWNELKHQKRSCLKTNRVYYSFAIKYQEEKNVSCLASFYFLKWAEVKNNTCKLPNTWFSHLKWAMSHLQMVICPALLEQNTQICNWLQKSSLFPDVSFKSSELVIERNRQEPNGRRACMCGRRIKADTPWVRFRYVNDFVTVTR